MKAKITVLFLIILVAAIVSCQMNGSNNEDIDLTSFAVGDTMHVKGTIGLDGRNNYLIYVDNFKDVPQCPGESLPNLFRQVGLRIEFSAIVLLPPSNVRMDCAPIEVLKIKPIN